MIELTAIGELLIDFTEVGTGENGSQRFERNPGGAVANVLAAAAKHGHATQFIGMVGNDIHGRYLKAVLEDAGIGTQHLGMTDQAFTTLAFVALDQNGERSFSFARKPGADMLLCVEDLPDALLSETGILHVGSLSLTDEPARSATFEAVRRAKEAGAVISYDPNYRAGLWKDKKEAAVQIRAMGSCADIIKISEEETALLTGYPDPETAARALTEQGAACALVTLGAKGAIACVGGKIQYTEGVPVSVVDTTGAGDAFLGGFLHCFLSENMTLSRLTLEKAAVYSRYGNAAAACCVSRRGAIPAMPSANQLRKFLRDRQSLSGCGRRGV